MSDPRDTITRRDFVRGTLAASLGVSLATGCSAQEEKQERPPRSARVVVVRDENALDEKHEVNAAVLEGMLGETVMRVTGEKTPKDAWLALVKPADVVGLVPTQHLNPTHDEVVQAVRTALVAAGIPEKNLRHARGGLDKAKACTALIALPALKAHWLTGIGTVLKNYILYSGDPERYHDERNVKLGEIWNLPGVKGKTRLVLVDALRPLCDKGPQVDPRYLWDYRGLVAGTDPVAVETVCLRILTEKRTALRGEPWPLTPPPLCVAAADETYGLGTSRWGEIRLDKAGWAQDSLI